MEPIEAVPVFVRGKTKLLSCAVVDMAESSNPAMPNPDLLANIELGSEDATSNEGGRAGLADRDELAAEDEAVEVEEESEEKTDPRTLFAFSREASFPNSI